MTLKQWIEKQKEIESKATSGIWAQQMDEEGEKYPFINSVDGGGGIAQTYYRGSANLDDHIFNAQFIAESRNNYRNMLDALEIAVKALSTITLTENDAADVYVNYRRDVTLKQIKENLGVT